jgi:hypothetical protein
MSSHEGRGTTLPWHPSDRVGYCPGRRSACCPPARPWRFSLVKPQLGLSAGGPGTLGSFQVKMRLGGAAHAVKPLVQSEPMTARRSRQPAARSTGARSVERSAYVEPQVDQWIRDGAFRPVTSSSPLVDLAGAYPYRLLNGCR